MKKFLSIFIAMMLLLNCTVFADSYDFLKASYTSFEAEFEISVDVNGETDFLNTLPGMEYIRNYVDVNGLVKGLSESEYTGKMKIDANEDYTKIKASYEMFSKVPVNVNRNLKVTAEAVYGMWIDYDITDESAPKLNYIYASPVFDKYLYMDMFSVMENEGSDVDEIISVIKSMSGKEYLKEMTDKMVEVIKNNSKATENGSKTTITITNEQMKSMISQVWDIVKEEIQKACEKNNIADEDITEEFSSFDISEYLDKMQIFEDKAEVIEFDKNADGTIKSADEKINFAIDLNSIAEAMGGELITEGPSVLKYSVSGAVNYSKVNQKVTVDFPELTEDNSVDFDEFNSNYSNYVVDYDWNGENCWHEEYISLSGDYLPAGETGPYCSINDFADELSCYGYDFDIQNGDGIVTVTENSGLERFKEAKISLDSTKVTVDGVEYSADNVAILSDEKVLVDFKTLELIFGVLPSDATVYLEENAFYASFKRQSPQCHHTEEEINSWSYGDGYCEHIQYVYSGDNRPYRGIKYFVLRDVVYGMFDYNEYIEHDLYYDLSYDSGVVTLVDLYGKEGFNTVIFTNGSNEILIDGNTFSAEAPVVIENGTTYVDFSTLNAIFGAEVTEQTLRFMNGYFDEELGMNIPSGFLYDATLTRKSPLCPHEVDTPER